ncbi:MAG: rod shape-determining protein MreD, partial [Steroidobacteraceae bacterium]
HALAFLPVAFITHKFQLRIRVFPIWQQSLTVFMLLTFYEFIVFWTDGIIGHPVTTWTRWVSVFTSALLWPLLVAIMDTWNRRSR